MSPLTITDSARTAIQSAIAAAGIAAPVVSLMQAHDVPSVDGVERLVGPHPTEAALRHAGLYEHRDSLQKVRWRLQAKVFPRDQVPADCQMAVQGILLSFSQEWQSQMQGWMLDLSPTGLVLKDQDGDVVFPVDSGQLTYYGE